MDAAHAEQKYHLPHGTSWPITGSIALFTLFVGVSMCSEGEGGLNAAQGTAFEAWKERNAARMARFNASPEGPRLLQERLQQARSVQQLGGAQAREARIALCAKVANALRPATQKGR